MPTSYGDHPTPPGDAATSTFARLLTALAALYLARPHLSLVHIGGAALYYRGPVHLQQTTSSRRGDPVGPLLDWADALDATTATVQRALPGGDWINLRIDGVLDGVAVQVWDGVDSLIESRLADGDTVQIADLRTAHGDAGRGAYHGNLARALAAVPHRCTYCGHDASSHSLRGDDRDGDRGGCWECPDSRESGRVCDAYQPRVTS